MPHLPSVERWRKGDRRQPYDPNVDATRQEMRSFACAQCHVEYYCGPKATLFFPWENGLKMEQIEATYERKKFSDGSAFADFVHAETGAPVYKAQHPEFEMWSQGVHARSGVSCADCHMPYKREGAAKISDHWVRSPLLNISRSCQTCHPYPEEELLERVHTIQDRTHALMGRAGTAIDEMLDAIAKRRTAAPRRSISSPSSISSAKRSGGSTSSMPRTRWDSTRRRKSARILAESIDYSRQAQIKARELHGAPTPPAEAAEKSPPPSRSENPAQ